MKWMMGLIAVGASLLLSGCGEDAVLTIETTPVEVEAGTVGNPPIVPTDLQVAVGNAEASVVSTLAELERMVAQVQEIPVEQILEEQTVVVKTALSDVVNSLDKMMDDLTTRLEPILAPAP